MPNTWQTHNKNMVEQTSRHMASAVVRSAMCSAMCSAFCYVFCCAKCSATYFPLASEQCMHLVCSTRARKADKSKHNWLLAKISTRPRSEQRRRLVLAKPAPLKAPKRTEYFKKPAPLKAPKRTEYFKYWGYASEYCCKPHS